MSGHADSSGQHHDEFWVRSMSGMEDDDKDVDNSGDECDEQLVAPNEIRWLIVVDEGQRDGWRSDEQTCGGDDEDRSVEFLVC